MLYSKLNLEQVICCFIYVIHFRGMQRLNTFKETLLLNSFDFLLCKKKIKQSPLFSMNCARLIHHVSIIIKMKHWKNDKDGVQVMVRDLHPAIHSNLYYVKKTKAISIIFNKLHKVNPLHINHNKNKVLKKRERCSTIK